jgi:hypothetical protein
MQKDTVRRLLRKQAQRGITAPDSEVIKAKKAYLADPDEADAKEINHDDI